MLERDIKSIFDYLFIAVLCSEISSNWSFHVSQITPLRSGSKTRFCTALWITILVPLGLLWTQFCKISSRNSSSNTVIPFGWTSSSWTSPQGRSRFNVASTFSWTILELSVQLVLKNVCNVCRHLFPLIIYCHFPSDDVRSSKLKVLCNHGWQRIESAQCGFCPFS